jgi:hypothetical protein
VPRAKGDRPCGDGSGRFCPGVLGEAAIQGSLIRSVSPVWYHDTVHRLFQDDLASVSISRLRASGIVTRDTKSVEIVFGEGHDGLRREVRVVHRRFPNGGEWSFFLCPICDRPARILKLHEKPMLSALLSSPRGWVSHIERLTCRARRRAGGPAPEVARAARRRAGEIASEAGPQAGPPMVAYGFVAERDDPRARGVAATAPQRA